MKIVIAVLALMPSLVSAQSNSAVYRPLPDTRCGYVDCIPPEPQPWPKPRPKPCKPWEGCHDPIVPLSSLKSKAASLTAAIADGKLDEAGAGLDGFYAGSASKEKGSSAVVAAGDWAVEPRESMGLSMPTYTPKGRSPLPSIEDARIIKVGIGEDLAKEAAKRIIIEGAKKAKEAIEKHVDRDQTKESIEKYGGCRMKGTCPK